MNSWIEFLEVEKKRVEEASKQLIKLQPVLELLDQAKIPTKGRISSNAIFIEDVDETIVSRLLKITTRTFSKYFSTYSGDLYYCSEIQDVPIYVYPDKVKFVCKVKKVETIRQEELTSVVFQLDSECDPLMLDETE